MSVPSVTEIKCQLECVSLGDKPLNVTITLTSRGVFFAFEGFTDFASHDSVGSPVVVENRNGVPYVVVWDDVNQEDPTHSIGLDDAANDQRKKKPIPHVEFEFDLTYTGGNYDGEGSYAYIPLSLVKELGAEEAFKKHTGHDWCHVIHYNPDELCDSEGNFLKIDDCPDD